MAGHADSVKINKLLENIAENYVKKAKLHVYSMKAAAHVIESEQKKVLEIYGEAQRLIEEITTAFPQTAKEPSNIVISKQFEMLFSIMNKLCNICGDGHE